MFNNSTLTLQSIKLQGGNSSNKQTLIAGRLEDTGNTQITLCDLALCYSKLIITTV